MASKLSKPATVKATLTRHPGAATKQQTGLPAAAMHRAKRRAPSLALALTLLILPGTSAAQAEADADLSQLESEGSARESLMQDVRAYERQIADLEFNQGAYSPALTEQLLALGLALQRNGDHEQAVKTFKRGVHLSRINEGLYGNRQIALLQGEIASHMALGSFTDADERQRYLYRVQQRTLSDTTRGQALAQHALWQRQAYEAGIGDDPFARLVRMWSLYRLALTELSGSEGPASPMLLTPLYGMLQSQYLISGFVGERTDGSFRMRSVLSQEESQRSAYRLQSYKQGSAVIRAIFDVEKAQPGAGFEDKIRTGLMLGDWQFWHGKRTEALEVYATVFRELEAHEGAQELTEEIFGNPQALPNLAGVRAIPEPERQQDGRLLLEFGVTNRGRVVDLQRLDGYEVHNSKADNIMRRLRQTLFRPRFVDGMPVNTEGLRWAYDTSKW